MDHFEFLFFPCTSFLGRDNCVEWEEGNQPIFPERFLRLRVRISTFTCKLTFWWLPSSGNALIVIAIPIVFTAFSFSVVIVSLVSIRPRWREHTPSNRYKKCRQHNTQFYPFLHFNILETQSDEFASGAHFFTLAVDNCKNISRPCMIFFVTNNQTQLVLPEQ